MTSTTSNATATTKPKMSLHAAYAVDKEAARNGRWFDFPELGEGARLLIAATKCNPDFTRCRERHFKAKYWDRGKQAPSAVQNAKAPLIYAETIVRGMADVSLTPGDPVLEDTFSNRVKLLQTYGEPLMEDVDSYANDIDNFRPEEMMDGYESYTLAPDVAAEVERTLTGAEIEVEVEDGDEATSEAEAASGN